jgi:DNA modification methylase
MSGSKEEKLPHPTQKPVDLMRRSLVNHGAAGDVVYEPFGGSGTTLAACELTGRVCICTEIEPRFVDVIVTRWQNLTGKEAVVGDGVYKGTTFEHVKFGRRLAAQDEIKDECLRAQGEANA